MSVIMDMATPGVGISGKEERIDQQDGCLLRLHDDQVVVGQVLLDKEEKEEEERWEQIGRGMHHLNVLMQGFVQTKMQEHLAKLPRFLEPKSLCDLVRSTMHVQSIPLKDRGTNQPSEWVSC